MARHRLGLFVFEKAWSQIKDEVRESAENEKWSGSLRDTRSDTCREVKHVRNPRGT